MSNDTKGTLSRRKFLVLSGAGATSMAFATSAMGREAVNLLDPGNPLIIPQNFKPSIWFTMEANGRTTVHVLRDPRAEEPVSARSVEGGAVTFSSTGGLARQAVYAAP